MITSAVQSSRRDRPEGGSRSRTGPGRSSHVGDTTLDGKPVRRHAFHRRRAEVPQATISVGAPGTEFALSALVSIGTLEARCETVADGAFGRLVDPRPPRSRGPFWSRRSRSRPRPSGNGSGRRRIGRGSGRSSERVVESGERRGLGRRICGSVFPKERTSTCQIQEKTGSTGRGNRSPLRRHR